MAITPEKIKATRLAGGKRLAAAQHGIEPAKAYVVEDAVKLVKGRAKAKFDETIEISMNLGVDPKHADQMVRGTVSLPNGTGRSVRVGVFARGAKAEEAKAAGADLGFGIEHFLIADLPHHAIAGFERSQAFA